MRKNIVAGNWKMNLTLDEGEMLTKEILNLVKDLEDPSKGIIVGVPFTHIKNIVNTVSGSQIEVSAQNCSAWESGAFTGEVSASMIQSTGAKYVILGHSERRKYFEESNDVLKTKVNLALENNLSPIFCIGEVLEERKTNIHFKVVEQQLSDSLFHLETSDFKRVIIAYEPVWAIGTGVTASAEQAQEMHAFIRQLLVEKFNPSLAQEISILYGGSCKPSNAVELFANKDVDGGLIGGASLNSEDFSGIIKALKSAQ